MHALPLAKLTKQGEIYCFEPDPHTFQSLSQNLVNHGAINRARLYQAGLSDSNSGGIEFVNYPGKGANNHVRSTRDELLKFVDCKPEIISIDLMTIDSVVHANVGFIKLDCEGLDFLAIKGAIDTITRSRCPVVFEMSPLLFKERYLLSELSLFWKEIDYTLLDLHGNIWGGFL